MSLWGGCKGCLESRQQQERRVTWSAYPGSCSQLVWALRGLGRLVLKHRQQPGGSYLLKHILSRTRPRVRGQEQVEPNRTGHQPDRRGQTSWGVPVISWIDACVRPSRLLARVQVGSGFKCNGEMLARCSPADEAWRGLWRMFPGMPVRFFFMSLQMRRCWGRLIDGASGNDIRDCGVW